jgi:hypothetical protein
MANLFHRVRIAVVSYNTKIAEDVHVAAYHTQYEMACRGPHKRRRIEGFLLQGFNEVILKYTKAHKNIVLFFLRHRLFFHWVLTRHILSIWSSKGGVMNAFMHLVDDHLVPSLEILHIHVIFWNFYNIHVIH